MQYSLQESALPATLTASGAHTFAKYSRWQEITFIAVGCCHDVSAAVQTVYGDVPRPGDCKLIW
jgi:hypothetical protein